MPVESAQYIDTLQPDWPLGTDPESAGDDHLRMIKQVLQNTFPNIKGVVQASQTELSYIHQLSWRTDHPSQPNGGYYQLDDPTGAGAAAWVVPSPNVATLKDLPAQAINWNTIMNTIYPVNSVVFYADSVNPGTRLGFGTWAAVTGMIAGAGSVTDSQGLAVSLAAGDHHANGYWRVQDGHIVQETKNLSISVTMDSAGNHHHTFPVNSGSSEGNAMAQGHPGGATGNPNTSDAGAHTHPLHASGTVVIGEGAKNSGAAFINPYYGLYVWRRTA